MRNIQIVEGEYCHVFNRGMHKQTIFKDQNDYLRFLFQILHLQSPKNFTNITEDTKSFKLKFLKTNGPSEFIKERIADEIGENRSVELIAFCLMPNHFHLIIKELSEGGIPMYLGRTQNGYTKYSNTKNKTSGHLLQGPYRIIHIKDNDQLLYTSAYIHRNCCELPNWKNKPQKYPWSSYQDYAGTNRWLKLIQRNDLLEQFDSPAEYDEWVKTSGAKDDGYLDEIKIIEQ